MKYSQGFSTKKSKFGTGFYMVIACCLLIIGAASWFALSNYAKEENTPDIQNSSEYQDKASSYIESETESSIQSTPSSSTEDVAEQVSDEPYSSEQATSEIKEEVKAFAMPIEGKILKDYSDTQLQYSATYGDMRLHSGIDIACQKGTSVSACSDGTVLSVENSSTLGNVLTIDHGNGIVIKYAALDDITLKQGDTVKVGDIIGTVTTVPSECSEESHLHIEVIENEKTVSPLEILSVN